MCKDQRKNVQIIDKVLFNALVQDSEYTNISIDLDINPHKRKTIHLKPRFY